MSKDTIWKRVIVYEIIGFGVIILIVWLNEIFDLPHYLFGAEKTPVNVKECLFETSVVLILAFFVIVFSIKFLKHIRYLEGFLHVCSFCKRINIDDEWIPLEEYITCHSAAKFSHGLCPDCIREHYSKGNNM